MRRQLPGADIERAVVVDQPGTRASAPAQRKPALSLLMVRTQESRERRGHPHDAIAAFVLLR
jgi:hypothetical protein